nr:hypothetical protein [Candidatus Sigynarchaeota archaeon]
MIVQQASDNEKDKVEGIIIQEYKEFNSMKIIPAIISEERNKETRSYMKIAKMFHLKIPIVTIKVPVQNWFYLVLFKDTHLIMAWVETRLPKLEAIKRIISSIFEKCGVNATLGEKFSYTENFYYDKVVPKMEELGFHAVEKVIDNGSAQWRLNQTTDTLPETSNDMYSKAEEGEMSGDVSIQVRIFDSDKGFFSQVRFNPAKDRSSFVLDSRDESDDVGKSIEETFAFLKELFGIDLLSGNTGKIDTGCTDAQKKILDFLKTKGKKTIAEKALFNLEKLTKFSIHGQEYRAMMPSSQDETKSYELSFNIASNAILHPDCTAWEKGGNCYHEIAFFLRIVKHQDALEPKLEEIINSRLK